MGNALSSSLENLKGLHSKLSQYVTQEWTKRDMLQKDIAAMDFNIKTQEDVIRINEKIEVVLAKAGERMRENAKVYFENIVTKALEIATQSTQYKFIIKELENRKTPSYEFYISTNVDGKESLQKPMEANGGSFVDIINIALKYGYSELYNSPKFYFGTSFYDEPAKMVSKQMAVEFSNYLKTLGQHFNRQTIMITHNEDLAAMADKTFLVAKDGSGISNVIDVDSVSIAPQSGDPEGGSIIWDTN